MRPSWRAPGACAGAFAVCPCAGAHGFRVVPMVRTPVVRAPGGRLPCQSGVAASAARSVRRYARGFRSGADYLRLGRLPLVVLRAAGLPVRAERRFS